MSRMARLAEGEVLSSNPLRRIFNGLRTTQSTVDVDQRILEPAVAVPSAATAGGPGGPAGRGVAELARRDPPA